MASSAAQSPPPPPASAAAPSWSGRNWLFVALVFAIVLAAYQPVWHAGFIWDDDSHVTANPCIVGPVGFAGIWTSPAANYFPLTTTTFWVLHALWGLNPLPYHVTDVLLHAASAVLLWLVLRRLRVPGAWLGALLWAVHPVQVESAAWISEVKNTQSAVFYLLSIWCFLGWLEAQPTSGRRRQIAHYLLALICAALAILSKASTVMLPLVLVLCWWWTAREWRWRDLLWLAPFFAISAVASGWTIWEQQFHSGALGLEWNQSVPERLIIAGNAVWFYLGKLIWPHPLIFIYARWASDASRLTEYLPGLAAAATWLILWWNRRRLPSLFFAATYFGVSLFPVLGFFKVFFQRYSFVGDHFQYLASMGVFALAGAGLVTAGARWQKWGNRLAPALGGLLVLALAVLTFRQSRIYASEDVLWQDTADKNPTAWIAHTNLGGRLIESGRFAEAIAHLEAALRLDPGVKQAKYNLALALFKANRPAEAIPYYQALLKAKPDDAEILANLGDAVSKLHRLPEAIRYYKSSLQIKPDNPTAQNNLGVVLLQTGQLEEALPHLREAVRLKPAYADAQNNLGNALLESGLSDEALLHLKAAVQAQPTFADAHFNLGLALIGLGHPAEGIEHLQQAVQLNPNDRDARDRLEEARRQFGSSPSLSR